MQRKTLAQLNIGANNNTFVIAEAGINHNGDFDLALKMVDEAKKAGASAIKFQTYVTEKRVPLDSPIYKILRKCELSQEQQRRIKEYADSAGIIFFSTPFDLGSVQFLRDIGVSLFKIASFDIVNEILLDAVAKTNIPVIMSRGMADAREIDRAVGILNDYNCEYALLHCISAYPTPKDAVNLNVIASLKKNYNCIVGYSDHTLDIDASVYAVAAGARIIEKHFTLDRNMEGPDHKMSVDPAELTLMCKTIRDVEIMLGNETIQSVKEEEGTKMYRRPTKIPANNLNKINSRIKIATPVSRLFNSSPEAEKAIAELSDALEVRELSKNTNFPMPKLYHCEYGLLHKWTQKEMDTILDIINKNPEITFITFHLPACYENSPIENNVYVPMGRKMNAYEMRENARANVKMLRDKIGYDIGFGVENNNYFTTGAYEIVTEPTFINELLSELNIKLLLDIGHARISAFNQNKTTDEYINEFNLNEVYQMHLNSPTVAKDACADSHKEMTEEDWDIFKKVLPRCPNVRYITIEYYKNFDHLVEMLKKLKQILYEFDK